jgi:hypothetical protein
LSTKGQISIPLDALICDQILTQRFAVQKKKPNQLIGDKLSSQNAIRALELSIIWRKKMVPYMIIPP